MAQKSERRAMYERTMPTRRYMEENAVRETEIESPIPREFEEQRRRNRKKRAIQERTEANRQRAKQYTLIQLGALALASAAMTFGALHHRIRKTAKKEK